MSVCHNLLELKLVNYYTNAENLKIKNKRRKKKQQQACDEDPNKHHRILVQESAFLCLFSLLFMLSLIYMYTKVQRYLLNKSSKSEKHLFTLTGSRWQLSEARL
ncbi:hypothetical protein E2542_SST05949 [Spatholobus suberectus]|nr:hypothetical protein E2542_SST05949 [Spatholobus suberectus]